MRYTEEYAESSLKCRDTGKFDFEAGERLGAFLRLADSHRTAEPTENADKSRAFEPLDDLLNWRLYKWVAPLLAPII